MQQGSEVSHVAAVALRQLQTELSTAHASIRDLQEEASALRRDARQLTEEQHAALVAAEAHREQVSEDNVQLRGLLGDMKGVLEALVQDNARLQAAAQPGLDLQKELEAVQEEVRATAQRLRMQESRAVAAEQVSHAAEAAQSRQQAALEAAKRDAACAQDDCACLRGQLEGLQRQMASHSVQAERRAQEQDEELAKLRQGVTAARAKCDRAELRAADCQAAQKQVAELEGKLERERRQRERAEASNSATARCVAAVLRDASCLHGAATQLAGQLREAQDWEAELSEGLGHARGSQICASLGHAEGLSRRVLMLLQLMTEAFEQLPRGSLADGSHVLPMDTKRLSPRGRHPPDLWSVGAVHQPGDKKKKAGRTLYPLAPRVPCAPMGEATDSSRPASAAASTAIMRAHGPAGASHVAPTSASAARAASCRQRSEGTQSLARTRAGRARAQARRQDCDDHTEREGSAIQQQQRERLAAVVASLEDELAVLDERYGDLLKTAHQLDADGSDFADSDVETQRESVAQATVRILDAMQRKGAQIRQLRSHCGPALLQQA